MCGVFVEDFLGKDAHFCPPCHEKEKDVLNSPEKDIINSPLIPPNDD
jgi:hypothetical protein